MQYFFLYLIWWRLNAAIASTCNLSIAVPWGAPQHHFQPWLCERGDWHPSALPVTAASHCGTGRRCKVEGPPGHHRVHAPVGRTAGESGSLGTVETHRSVLMASLIGIMCRTRNIRNVETNSFSGLTRTSILITLITLCFPRELNSLMRNSTRFVWPGSLTTVRHSNGFKFSEESCESLCHATKRLLCV